MADEQALLLSAIAASQREMQQQLADIVNKQKQIEALCGANQEELCKSQEAYRDRQAAAQDEYRKTQETYRSVEAAKQAEYQKSQEAYRENENVFKWSRLPCFVTTVIIVGLVAYIAWRVS